MMPVRLRFSLSTIYYATIPIQYITHDPLLYNPLQGKQLFFLGNIEIFPKNLQTWGITGRIRKFTRSVARLLQQKTLQGPPIEAKRDERLVIAKLREIYLFFEPNIPPGGIIVMLV